MKLRIRGNSLRLRLTRSEVSRLDESARVEEMIEFGPEPHQRLRYAIESSTDTSEITVSYDDGRILVQVPRSAVRQWSETDQISLGGEQPLAGNAKLSLLVEKDFACLTGREGDEDADAFPHPMEGMLKC